MSENEADPWRIDAAFAWAAGFFEGEGSAGCFGGQGRANVSQRDLALLQRFQTIMGFGSIGGPNRQGVSYWQAGKRHELYFLLKNLGPWLSSRRVRQLLLAIDSAPDPRVIRPPGPVCSYYGSTIPCDKGYALHRRRGEVPCQRCRQCYALFMVNYRRNREK